MFDAFVKPLMILHCCGGMSLVLSIHNIVPNDHDPDNVDEDSILRQRLRGVTEGGNSKDSKHVEITIIIGLVRFSLRLPQGLQH